MAKTNKYDAIAPQLLELLGGKDNIRSIVHCMTRLRFNVKDKSIVDDKKIGELPGCMGTQWANDQLQVVIGQSVDLAYDAVCRARGLQKEPSLNENLDNAPKKKITFLSICETVSGCIVPLIPLFMACGLTNVLIALANLAGILPKDSSTYQILYQAGRAGLYFVPIVIASSAAQKLETSPILAMAICCILLYPNMSTLINGEVQATLFGIPVYAVSYGNMVFPSLLIVFVMKYVERFFKKYVPEVIRVMMVPFLTFIVMVPLALCLLAPLGVMIGNVISSMITLVFAKIGFVAVGILAALYPLLVFTGMHSSIAPTGFSALIEQGRDPIVMPATHLANFCQSAAALGVMIKSKKEDVKGIAGAAAMTAFISGITEPALFGVNFRYRTPLICSLIGGFIGGCYAGLMGCGMLQIGGSGVFCLTNYIGPDIMNVVNFAISMAIGFVVTLILTLITFKDSKE